MYWDRRIPLPLVALSFTARRGADKQTTNLNGLRPLFCMTPPPYESKLSTGRRPTEKAPLTRGLPIGCLFVEIEGFEPSLTEPESVVLPLHHISMYPINAALGHIGTANVR